MPSTSTSSKQTQWLRGNRVAVDNWGCTQQSQKPTLPHKTWEGLGNPRLRTDERLGQPLLFYASWKITPLRMTSLSSCLQYISRKGDHVPRNIIFSPNAPKPPATYSQAVKAAGLVFVSGTGPQ